MIFDPNGPGGPPPAARPRGFVLGAVALILGLLGCVVPLLPLDLTTERPYLPFPFALPGLVLAIAGCTGRRRGLPLAVAGAILSALALAIGTIMLAG